MSISSYLLRRAAWAAMVWSAAGAAWAQVSVHQPWARATVEAQKSSGAFMTLNAPQGARLVSVSTPVAAVAEIHEMKMDGDVMRMRAIDGLDLPAGQDVELKPGGYHLMFMNLKQPLKEGQTLPLTLHVRDAAGQSHEIAVEVPVRAMGRAAGHAHGAGQAQPGQSSGHSSSHSMGHQSEHGSQP